MANREQSTSVSSSNADLGAHGKPQGPAQGALLAAATTAIDREHGHHALTQEELGGRIRDDMRLSNSTRHYGLSSGIHYPHNYIEEFKQAQAMSTIDVEHPDPVVLKWCAPELVRMNPHDRASALRVRRAEALQALHAAPFRSLPPSLAETGYANPDFFENVGGGWRMVRLKRGRSASAAMKAWFSGPTITYCDSATTACQIDAIRVAMGDGAFDKQFGNRGAATDTPLEISIDIIGTSFAAATSQANDGHGFKGHEGAFGKRPVVVGDHVRFWNHPAYVFKHPTGVWRLENAVYMGAPSGIQTWSGLGCEGVSEDGMCERLVEAYNQAPAADNSIMVAAAKRLGYVVPHQITKHQLLTDSLRAPLHAMSLFESATGHGGYDRGSQQRVDARLLASQHRSPHWTDPAPVAATSAISNIDEIYEQHARPGEPERQFFQRFAQALRLSPAALDARITVAVQAAAGVKSGTPRGDALICEENFLIAVSNSRSSNGHIREEVEARLNILGG